MVARDLKKWVLPEEMVLYHYINDVMLTRDDLSSLSQAAMSLQSGLLKDRRMGGKHRQDPSFGSISKVPGHHLVR